MKLQGWNRFFRQIIFNYYLPILVVLIIVSVLVFVISAKAREDLNLLLVWFGGIVSFFYFVQKQQTEELRLFSELYRDFNKRYGELNERLNHIASENGEAKLLDEDRDLLFDYFNLCSEEYLYYTRGYIFPEVWTAWCNGIYFFLKVEKIRALWVDEEKNAASYYGLTLEEIESHVTVKP